MCINKCQCRFIAIVYCCSHVLISVLTMFHLGKSFLNYDLIKLQLTPMCCVGGGLSEICFTPLTWRKKNKNFYIYMINLSNLSKFSNYFILKTLTISCWYLISMIFVLSHIVNLMCIHVLPLTFTSWLSPQNLVILDFRSMPTSAPYVPSLDTECSQKPVNSIRIY